MKLFFNIPKNITVEQFYKLQIFSKNHKQHVHAKPILFQEGSFPEIREYPRNLSLELIEIAHS